LTVPLGGLSLVLVASVASSSKATVEPTLVTRIFASCGGIASLLDE
jgi:hypothetical protein